MTLRPTPRKVPQGSFVTTRRFVLALATSCVALHSAPTLAAEVTDLAPRFRGDVHLGYGGGFQQVGIAEPALDGTDTVWGIRNVWTHDLALRGEVAVWDGIGVTIGLPITIQQRIAYPAAREMFLEPTTEQGSYVSGQPIDVDPVISGGLQGAWFGVAVQPFSEDRQRTDGFSLPATLRIDLGVRTPNAKGTLYGNNRGAAPGGVGVRFALAASARRGATNPYFQLDYVAETKATIPQAVENDGTVIATDLVVKGANQLDARMGSEFILKENTDKATRAALYVDANVGWRGWQDQASGYWLPDVLEPARNQTTTRSPYLRLGLGLGADVHINRYIGLRTGVEGRWITSHVIENLYAARTDPGSYEVGWSLDVVGRIRTAKDAKR